MIFRRRKPTRTVNPHAADIRVARMELREIEFQLSRLDHRRDIAKVRSLTGRHQAWREHLDRLGVNHPIPAIAW